MWYGCLHDRVLARRHPNSNTILWHTRKQANQGSACWNCVNLPSFSCSSSSTSQPGVLPHGFGHRKFSVSQPSHTFTSLLHFSLGSIALRLLTNLSAMNVRAQGLGMASQTQNVANSIFQQFFPTFLANCGL